mmetsp:Transcript_44369/g.128370  ORF Transcript_44369/g.128370 Transcript_44369/m.128370 type:complete len:281 (-) Transcript_44369:170-1012(-)
MATGHLAQGCRAGKGAHQRHAPAYAGHPEDALRPRPDPEPGGLPPAGRGLPRGPARALRGGLRPQHVRAVPHGGPAPGVRHVPARRRLVCPGLALRSPCGRASSTGTEAAHDHGESSHLHARREAVRGRPRADGRHNLRGGVRADECLRGIGSRPHHSIPRHESAVESGGSCAARLAWVWDARRSGLRWPELGWRVAGPARERSRQWGPPIRLRLGPSAGRGGAPLGDRPRCQPFPSESLAAGRSPVMATSAACDAHSCGRSFREPGWQRISSNGHLGDV